MAKPSNNASISTFADHEVIVPEHRLQGVVTTMGRDVGPDLEAIARAEAALQRLSGEFDGWMQAEADRLDAVRRTALAAGMEKKPREELFRAAHDIKGEGATFGYPLAAEAADSLCRLIEHAPAPDRIPAELVDQHVDGIRAIIRETAKEISDPVGTAMVARLREVTDSFLIEANRHRPDYLDGIIGVTPPRVERI